MSLRPFAALLLVLSLGACAAPSPGPMSEIALPAGLRLNLPKPAAMGRPVDAAQSVIVDYVGGTVAFEGRIAATADRFYLVCVDPMGRRALSAEWTAAGATFETAPWLPSLLRPENVLADIIVVYAPETVLQQALPGAIVTDQAGTRTVSVNGRDVLHVEYAPADGDVWAGKAVYRNAPWHYTLTIQSAELSP